jgi:hypothetical protein
MENGNNRQSKSSHSTENLIKSQDRILRYIHEQNKRPEVVITEVEEFLKAYKAGEEIITPEAQKMTLTTTKTKKGWLGRPKKIIESNNFCDAIGEAITNYQVGKELSYPLKWEHAFTLLDLIQRARVFGVLRNAKQQQRHSEEEILRLKEELDNLKRQYDEVSKENKMMHNIVDANTDDKNKGKGNTVVGDVGFY